MSPLTFIFVCIAVIVITCVVFGAWIVVSLVKFVLRGVGMLFGGPAKRDVTTIASLCCPRRSCQSLNPTSAHFCRRCGMNLARDLEGRPIAGRFIDWDESRPAAERA